MNRLALPWTSADRVMVAIVIGVVVLVALVFSLATVRPERPAVRAPSSPAVPSPRSSGSPGAHAIDLALGSPAFVFSVVGLLPGTSVDAAVVLQNRGLDPLRYAVTASTTNSDGKGLAGAMTLEIRALGSSCRAFDGEILYEGPLNGAGIGRPVPGSDPGDRTLRPGATETLCLRATLPIGVGNALQDATTTMRLSFVAEPAE